MTAPPESIVCDLDGVLYRGEQEIPGAGDALAVMDGSGIDLTFVTNNASKSPAEAAAKIERVTGYPAEPDQVLTSAQAAASLLAAARPPTLLFGAAGARDPLQKAGVPLVTDWRKAEAVVTGLDLNLSYESLTAAVMAVQRGARFIATNADVTFPSPEGQWPGAGAMVAAVVAATGIEPEVAGKPEPAMRELLRHRLIGRRIAVIVDRPDTDLALAARS